HPGIDGCGLRSRGRGNDCHQPVGRGHAMSSENAVIIDLKFERREVDAALERAFTGRQVLRAADRDQDLSEARYAVVWKPEAGLFQRAPKLEVLFSGGAGVDHVLTLPDLPDIPIVRFVDDSLT